MSKFCLLAIGVALYYHGVLLVFKAVACESMVVVSTSTEALRGNRSVTLVAHPCSEHWWRGVPHAVVYYIFAFM